jgi:endonuclease YncB( thermonuclease family)
MATRSRCWNGAEPLHVRFACFDAPELAQIPFGVASRRTLQDLLPLGTNVALRVKAVDRYGRTVAEVSHGPSNLNQAMVAAGQAFVYWSSIAGCDRETYARLENEARLRRMGFWSEPVSLQRPWSFRQERRHGGHRTRQLHDERHCDRDGVGVTCEWSCLGLTR